MGAPFSLPFSSLSLKGGKLAPWAVSFLFFFPVAGPATLRAFSGVGLRGPTRLGLGVVFAFKGTLRVPLHRFLAVTSAILMLVAFQLALTGLHELSEARRLPSSKQEMALIGPIVRNELFFFVFVFGAAMLLILREWQSASHEKSAKEAVGDAERRLLGAEKWKGARRMIASTIAGPSAYFVGNAGFFVSLAR